MWHRLQNFFLSFRTYPDLSPDLKLRRSLNRRLRDRPCLSFEQWFKHCWQSHDISQPVAAFVYTQFERYSGLTFARVLPSDRLEEDLRWSLVCWFDWQITLCDDFFRQFGVDISDRLDDHSYGTLEELVVFLEHQLLTISSPQ